MEDMTEEEIEAMQNQVVTTLKSVEESFEGHDLDAFLPSKDEMKSLKDDGKDEDGAAWTTLSASDAEIRGDLYELTGCLLYTSPSPRDNKASRMPSSA